MSVWPYEVFIQPQGYQYFSYIVAVSFISEWNRSARRNPSSFNLKKTRKHFRFRPPPLPPLQRSELGSNPVPSDQKAITLPVELKNIFTRSASKRDRILFTHESKIRLFVFIKNCRVILFIVCIFQVNYYFLLWNVATELGKNTDTPHKI